MIGRIISLLVVVFLGHATAWGASYYVSPSGSGSTCSSGSPCSFTTGLNNAFAGDEVVAKNGTYNYSIQTVRSGSSGNPIVIRAENRHQAILNQSGGVQDISLDIDHNYITVQGFVFDNQGEVNRGFFMVDLHPTGSNSTINNFILEYNILKNSGSGGVYMRNASNIILRHNKIDTTRLNSGNVGEGFYIGQNSNSPLTQNVEVYANWVTDTRDNFVDYKNPTRNVNVHHNIFENHISGDGLIRSQYDGSDTSSGNKFENNIVREATNPCCGIFYIDRKSTRLNSIHSSVSRMPSSA